MRTNVTLDEDVHQFASNYAVAKGMTLGAAISELIRKVEAAPAEAPELGRSASGLPCFPRRGQAVTRAAVKKIEDELG